MHVIEYFEVIKVIQNVAIEYGMCKSLTISISLQLCHYLVPFFRYSASWHDHKIWVRGHSGSLEMASFDRSHTSSYWRSVVTMALSCIVSEIKRYTLVENRDFLYPTCTRRPC